MIISIIFLSFFVVSQSQVINKLAYFSKIYILVVFTYFDLLRSVFKCEVLVETVVVFEVLRAMPASEKP